MQEIVKCFIQPFADDAKISESANIRIDNSKAILQNYIDALVEKMATSVQCLQMLSVTYRKMQSLSGL